jgi:aconitate hydratase
MGAELGATTSVFPSDEVTRAFLKAQGREADFRELSADPDAAYDEMIEIQLDELVPLVARPHLPDNVETVEKVGPIKVDQVFIGSCTNSSYQDMMRVARILKGKTVHPDVSLVIGPGSKQVLTMLAKNGALADMLNAGARILECACGPCIGMGQSPKTNAVSVRTNNRNFYARSGTASAGIYLTSCETAAVTAIAGVLTDPRGLDIDLTVEMPASFDVNDFRKLPFQIGDDELSCSFLVPDDLAGAVSAASYGKGTLSPAEGGMVWTIDAANVDDAAAWAIAYGIRPLEPEALVEAWRARLEEVLHG